MKLIRLFPRRPDGIAAMGSRLTKEDRHNRKLSHAYPLVVWFLW